MIFGTNFEFIFKALKLGLSLICSKFYLLFLPELPKFLTHYSYFILTSSPIIPTYSCNFIVSVIIMSTIHTVTIILMNRILTVQTFLQSLHEILLPSWTSSPSSSFKQSLRSFHYIYPLQLPIILVLCS